MSQVAGVGVIEFIKAKILNDVANAALVHVAL